MSNDLTLKPIEFEKIKVQYPGRIPVFVTKASGIKSDIPDLPKNKFLVQSDLTVGNFLYIIRRQIKLPAEKALFIFCNNTLPMTSMTIGQLYNLHKSSDQALHLIYTSESTFGN